MKLTMIRHVKKTWILFFHVTMILNIVQSDHHLDQSQLSDTEMEDTYLGDMEHLSQGPSKAVASVFSDDLILFVQEMLP